ncbi:MAG: SDR family oxidoreductase [Elainellaceae cyanobacterium]|jgi:short-subunit dehydrogenase|uniref:SDR family oxidoreductase n=1 Tax=Leptolyngbya sp. CCY15150 TaxID=2767772 RepID=UPI00194E59D2|nr:SDR family oxidoreductase [Leptolyngbya sp. CCY15150]
MDIQQRHRALITGASSGIGKATALAFAQAGVDLVLLSRSKDNLLKVADEARSHQVDVQIHPLDLTNLEQIQPAIAAIAQQGEPITILVNNAGMGYTGTLVDTSLKDWQAVLTLNLTSVFQCIQGILPSMRDRQQGTIINVGSIAGHQAFPGWGAYNVSKAGLIALSKTLAAEERSHGIRVTLITPGAVNTPIWDTDTVQADFNRTSMLTPEIVAQTIVQAALLPAQAVIDELVVMPSAGAL